MQGMLLKYMQTLYCNTQHYRNVLCIANDTSAVETQIFSRKEGLHNSLEDCLQDFGKSTDSRVRDG